MNGCSSLVTEISPGLLLKDAAYGAAAYVYYELSNYLSFKDWYKLFHLLVSFQSILYLFSSLIVFDYATSYLLVSISRGILKRITIHLHYFCYNETVYYIISYYSFLGLMVLYPLRSPMIIQTCVLSVGKLH